MSSLVCVCVCLIMGTKSHFVFLAILKLTVLLCRPGLKAAETHLPLPTGAGTKGVWHYTWLTSFVCVRESVEPTEDAGLQELEFHPVVS